MENKEKICGLLLETLKETTAGKNISELVFDSNSEIVTIHFENGHSKACNVGGDSGIAIISDILNAIK